MSITKLSLEQLKALPREEQEALYNKISAVRKVYKATNYAATYGAGANRIALTAGCSPKRGEKLVGSYWKRNWSVRAIADEQIVKTCNGKKWLFNPVSRLWYVLRYEKDRFSTLNQGTGVWCFDQWVKHIKAGGVPVIFQAHDEVCCLVRKGKRDKLSKFLKKCIADTNEELKLNRELDISIDYGDNYSQIH